MCLSSSAFLLIASMSSAAGMQSGTAAPSRPAFRSEDVRYESGSLALAALLMLPASERPTPGAVVIQGSGTSDRSNPWARAIAEELVRAGVTVLLTDKRGSGASGGDWRTADFEDLAQDALAGTAYLETRPEVDPRQIGVVGLSQGGWIAPLAAARSDRIAFVISVSAAAVSFAEQSFHELANSTRQAGLAEDAVQEALDLNRAVARYLTTGNWDAYDRALRRAVTTTWKRVAEGFPASPELPIWTFLRGVADYDPLPYWIALEEPVLVLYGAEDEQDNVPVRESVRRLEFAFGAVGKRNYRIVVVPGAGHGFMDAASHELMAAFVDALHAWVREYVTVFD